MPVVVIFVVGFVMLLLVRSHVGERKAIVRCDEIYRRPRLSEAAVKQIRGTSQARRKIGAQPCVAAPETAHGIAEAVVPFGEARRMIAELIAAGADVPRLGNQLALRQDRMLAERVEKSRARVGGR